MCLFLSKSYSHYATPVITNPGYSSGGESSIPYPLTIPIPKSDKIRIEQSTRLWDEQVQPRLIARSKLCDPAQLDEQMDLRQQIAEQLLAVSRNYNSEAEHTQEIEEVEELVTPGDDW